ncbi:hypothetical protein H0H92_011634 [Tricholoma furcatifolium]|nr:hypothetical protein H0H92_011634 [Tricholoma furcatifolium]
MPRATPAAPPAPRTLNPPPIPQQQRETSIAPSIISQQPCMSAIAQAPASSPSSFVHPSAISSTPILQNSQAQLPSSSPPLFLGQHSTNSVSLSDPLDRISCTTTKIDVLPIQRQTTTLPNPSPPASSAKSDVDNVIDKASETTSGSVTGTSSTSTEFLASLRESTQLYDLPRTQLEQLIGEVVREEGFPKLASHPL